MRRGQVLNGRYRLEERLGAGGFGVVWKAYDPQVQRAVAVKIGTHRSTEASLRMVREAKLNGSLPHPHIATVYDFGQADLDGEPAQYLVMELIEGEPLSAVLGRGEPPLASALEWAAQICAALGAAHDAGVVHRDIKPANVMITRTGTVKVLDFGIARELSGGGQLTGEHSIIGSLPYMAPERWTNEGVDGRADLYALGCVLLQLCTGQLPFPGEEWQELCVQHTTEEPPVPSALRPGLPEALDELVRELLAKDPAERPAHAGEVERRLRGILPNPAAAEDVDVEAPVPMVQEGVVKRGRRWFAGAAAAGAVAVIAVGVWQVLPLVGGETGDRAADRGAGSPSAAGRGPVASEARSSAATESATPSPSVTTASVSPAPRDSPEPPEPAPSDSPAAERTAAPKPPPLPTGWFRFTNASTRLCLAVPEGSTTAAEGLVQADCTGGADEFWRLTDEGRGASGVVYSIRNGTSGLCLSVDAARKEEGVVITQYLCGDEDHDLFADQYWRFRYDATYRAWQLISANSGKCVSVREGGGRQEQALQLACGSSPWLLWRT